MTTDVANRVLASGMSKSTRLAGAIFVLLVAAVPGGLLAAPGDADELVEAARAGDANAATTICRRLAEAGGVEGLRAILKVVPDAAGGAYWPLVRGAASFTDRPALEELGRHIVAARGKAAESAGDLLFCLQENARPEVVWPLRHVLEKGRYELQLVAVNQLAFVRSQEAVDALLEAWRAGREPELSRRLQGALLTLTGVSFASVEEATTWWAERRAGGLPDHELRAEPPRSRELRSFARGERERVVVLSGDRRACPDDPNDVYDLDNDRIQEILERREIPHTVVPKHEFEKDPKRYLARCRALLLNCTLITTYCVCARCDEGKVAKAAQTNRLTRSCSPDCDVHVNVNHRLSRKALTALQSWVEDQGGYLYTEDWGIVEVLGLLWPKHVRSGTYEAGPRGEVVDRPRLIRGVDESGALLPSFDAPLVLRRGSSTHPLLRGVWQHPDRLSTRMLEHVWQIDDESPAIEVVGKDVIVLLDSPWLQRLADGHTAVAVTFRPGPKTRLPESGAATGEAALVKSGRVLHTLSHFGKQSTKSDGEALEHLLVNFILEADRRHQGR